MTARPITRQSELICLISVARAREWCFLLRQLSFYEAVFLRERFIPELSQAGLFCGIRRRG